MPTAHETLYQTLQREFTEAVRDPLWGHIYLSPAIKSMLASPALRKLSNIKQLGPTHFLYPGAVHTRLSHSLGVFEIGKKMILKLLLSDRCPPLSLCGVRSFLVACLLHDTGHFPYAHSLKELPLKAHETITGELILQEPLASLINRGVCGNAQLAAAIVDPHLPIDDSPFQTEAAFYRRLLSGVLDPDKLDYLNRDAFFCGVPYGIQDIDFIIDNLLPDPEYGLAVTPKGIEAVENILFSKYLMYKSVYWHKTVRIATAMIKKSILLGLQEGFIQPDELYLLTDDAFIARFTASDYPYARPVRLTEERRWYVPISEFAFDPDNPWDTALSDLSKRPETEARLAQAAGMKPEGVIVDVPEPISFETQLRIKTDTGLVPFGEGKSVFTPSVIDNFQHSLRKVRLLVDPDCADSLHCTRVLRQLAAERNRP